VEKGEQAEHSLKERGRGIIEQVSSERAGRGRVFPAKVLTMLCTQEEESACIGQ
jgi:hypothetical protein